jgi:hypothetical protein
MWKQCLLPQELQQQLRIPVETSWFSIDDKATFKQAE